jgi:hypothetical protein
MASGPPLFDRQVVFVRNSSRAINWRRMRQIELANAAANNAPQRVRLHASAISTRAGGHENRLPYAK